MPNLQDKIERARWLMGRGRFGEALQCLSSEQVAVYEDSPEGIVSVSALTGSCQLSLGKSLSAVPMFRFALECAHVLRPKDDLFTWITRYNLGLGLLLDGRPRDRSMPEGSERESLEEALAILTTTSQAVHATPTFANQRHTLSGQAMALSAEILYMLGRYEQAVNYAHVATEMLIAKSHLANAARRLLGCYGIFRAVDPEWRHPAGYNAHVNPPGIINGEEADTYAFLKLPVAA